MKTRFKNGENRYFLNVFLSNTLTSIEQANMVIAGNIIKVDTVIKLIIGTSCT